jgi:hypothetical protein
MFTIPSLRARECTKAEKDWLNYAFVAVPIVNIILPFAWKSFAFVYSADCVLLAGIYYWKVVQAEESESSELPAAEASESVAEASTDTSS